MEMLKQPSFRPKAFFQFIESQELKTIRKGKAVMNKRVGTKPVLLASSSALQDIPIYQNNYNLNYFKRKLINQVIP